MFKVLAILFFTGLSVQAAEFKNIFYSSTYYLHFLYNNSEQQISYLFYDQRKPGLAESVKNSGRPIFNDGSDYKK